MNALGRRRWWLWLALLAVAAWLAIFGDKTPAASPPLVGVGARASVPPSIAVAASGAASIPTADRSRVARGPTAVLEPLQPRDTLITPASSERPIRDIFSAASWAPPAPPVAAPVPAAPVPPPFTFVGKKLEGEQWEVYLARGEQSFIARQGSTIDGSYRVDKIEPPTLTMTQLPQAQTMTIAIGETR